MGKFFNFIYGSEPFELSFDTTLEIAIQRLKANVSTTSFSKLASQRMVGSVSENGVKISRVIPMVQNSFKPVLIGTFKTEGNKTVLSGILRFHRLVQFFMTFWFGFVGLWTLLTLLAAIAKPGEAILFPLAGILMFGFGVGFVAIGKWFSRNDKRWLIDNISNSIA